jgi:hypothetical protein
VGHELVNRVMACLQQLGDQIIHGGQDIAQTERLQHICVARLVERSLRIAVVTHLSPFLYPDNRGQGAIPESGQRFSCREVCCKNRLLTLLSSSERGRITGRYLMRVVPSQGLPYFIATGVIATPTAALRVAER